MSTTPPETIISHLVSFTDEQPNLKLFAVIDAAQDAEIYPLFRKPDSGWSCLLEGEVPPVLMEAAPFLVRIQAHSPLTRRLMDRGWGRSWGSYLVTTDSMHGLRDQLRQLLMVKAEGEGALYFRFYDPRVLQTFLPTCSRDQLREVFGRTRYLITELEHGDGLVAFSHHSGRLFRQQVLFEVDRPALRSAVGADLAPLDGLGASVFAEDRACREQQQLLERRRQQLQSRLKEARTADQAAAPAAGDAAAAGQADPEAELERLREAEAEAVEALGQATMHLFRAGGETPAKRAALEQAVERAEAELGQLDPGASADRREQAEQALAAARERLEASRSAVQQKEARVNEYQRLKEQREAAEQELLAHRQSQEDAAEQAPPAGPGAAPSSAAIEGALDSIARLQQTVPPGAPSAAEPAATLRSVAQRLDQSKPRRMHLDAQRSRLETHHRELDSIHQRLRQSIRQVNSQQGYYISDLARDAEQNKALAAVEELQQEARDRAQACDHLQQQIERAEHELADLQHELTRDLDGIKQQRERRMARLAQVLEAYFPEPPGSMP